MRIHRHRRGVLGLVAAGIVAFSIASSQTARAEPRPLPDAAVFYAEVQKHYAPMFENYVGTETRVSQNITRTNSKTGEVRERRRVILRVRDYYHRDREVKVLESWKNGEREDPDDYTVRGSKVARHPLLGPDGTKHYRVTVLRREQKLGHTCLALFFVGREKTERHLEGTVWIDEESKDLVAVDLRPAKLPFAVTAISIQAAFRQEGSLTLAAGSLVRVKIHVPIVFPNNLLVIREEVLAARGLPSKAAAASPR